MAFVVVGHGWGIPGSRAETPPELVPVAIDAIPLLADAAAAALERAAPQARDPEDRAAAARASQAARELADLYA